ncbi:MAG: histidinol-phosphate transaminase [Cyclonatronaceae bacterium]
MFGSYTPNGALGDDLAMVKLRSKNMSMLVPAHIRTLKPYIAGKTIEEVVREYNPPRISKLASNENRLGCSPDAKEAVIRSMDQIMNYPDPASKVLRERLARQFGIKTENVITGSGSEGVMALITRTFFLDTEEALTADATFIGFVVLANSRGVKLRRVPLTEDYRFDLDAIAAAIRPETKVIYLANPNNPTGTYFTRDQFEAFHKKVPDHVLVIMDEAYFEYARDVEDYPDSMKYRFDNVITLRTFSKAYGLAGLRIGYGFAHEEIISNLMKVKLPFEPSTPAQAAALAALDDSGFLERSVKMVHSGRQRLYDFLSARNVHYVESVSNSVMTVFENEKKAEWFTDAMLRKGVILRRLPAFGLPNCVRITIGTPDEMEHFESAFDELGL